jgi:alpha-tubulin suppressor-like RCC1 family protein
VCEGTALTCDDDLECSVDRCDEQAGGCVFDTTGCSCFDHVDCNDNNACNGVERCVDNACVAGTALSCMASTSLCVETFCDPAVGCSTRNRVGTCDDGDPCTEFDSCSNGVCGGLPKTCTATDACEVGGTCDPATGACVKRSDGSECDSLGGLEGACDKGVCEPYLRLAAGEVHACAVKLDRYGENGRLKCWGRGADGALGTGQTTNVGDAVERAVLSAPEVEIGFDVQSVVVGQNLTCALSRHGAVKCWGDSTSGRTGYGVTSDIVRPREASVNFGAGVAIASLSARQAHVCARTVDDALYCWGDGEFGKLGRGDSANVGDLPTRLPETHGLIEVRADVAEVTTGVQTTCIRLADGTVKCWGNGSTGALGYGNTANKGGSPSTVPYALPGVPITNDAGVLATRLSGGATHVCAMLSNGQLKCWGQGANGALGFGVATNIGDDELPSSTPPIDLGASNPTILDVQGNLSTCVLYLSGGVRRLKCFGYNFNGSLGQGNTALRSGPAADVPPIALGGQVQSFALGTYFGCAVMRDGKVRCWGQNTYGQLGQGNTSHIGDASGEMPPAETVIFAD